MIERMTPKEFADLCSTLLICATDAQAAPVIAACGEAGIKPVLAYSYDRRRDSLVRHVSHNICVGPEVEDLSNAYAILKAVRECEACAVHLCDGPLAKNEEFISAAKEAGLYLVDFSPEKDERK